MFIYFVPKNMHRSRLFPLIAPVIFLCFSFETFAQLVSGPMLGQVELRTAKIWVEVKPGSTVDLWYWKKDQSAAQKLTKQVAADSWFGTMIFDLVGLDPNTIYEYAVVVNNKLSKRDRKSVV